MSEILEAIDIDKIRGQMNEFIITHENIDEAYEKYSYGILDTFNHCLNEEEASNLLSSFTEHNIKKEQKFTEFMKLAFELNDNEPVIVNMPFHELESTYILHILNMLDYTDRILFIENIRKVQMQSTYYKATNIELLEMFTRLATRELYFTIFYFSKIPMILVGNFDLSFPLFCLDKENIKNYKTIADRCGLFIRDITERDAIN